VNNCFYFDVHFPLYLKVFRLICNLFYLSNNKSYKKAHSVIMGKISSLCHGYVHWVQCFTEELCRILRWRDVDVMNRGCVYE